MATPVGHGLAGLSLFLLAIQSFRGRRRATLLLLVVVFALLPDFDFIPGILIGQPAAYHHGISHSLGAGIVAALLGAWIARRWWPAQTGLVFLLLFAAYSSHLLFDFFGTDSRPPYGIPLFWPLSSAPYLSPIPLFTGVRHVRSTEGLLLEWIEGVISWHNVLSVGREVLLLLPLVLAFWYLGRMRTGTMQTTKYTRRYPQSAKEADETVT
jgi:inner membrane protein